MELQDSSILNDNVQYTFPQIRLNISSYVGLSKVVVSHDNSNENTVRIFYFPS